MARNLAGRLPYLYFAHKSYKIESGLCVAEGAGAGYNLTEIARAPASR